MRTNNLIRILCFSVEWNKYTLWLFTKIIFCHRESLLNKQKFAFWLLKHLISSSLYDLSIFVEICSHIDQTTSDILIDVGICIQISFFSIHFSFHFNVIVVYMVFSCCCYWMTHNKHYFCMYVFFQLEHLLSGIAQFVIFDWNSKLTTHTKKHEINKNQQQRRQLRPKKTYIYNVLKI